MITEENYEAFYIDYLEGTLSPSLTKELEAFLALNPALKLEDEEVVNLIPTQATFNEKDKLKAFDINETISLSNIEDFLIADVENLLSKDKKNELTAFLTANAHLQKDANLYAVSKLYTNPFITYKNKKSLKQKGKIILWPYISVAAGLALIISIGFNSFNLPGKQYAESKLDLNVDYNDDTEVFDLTKLTTKPKNTSVVTKVAIKEKKKFITPSVSTLPVKAIAFNLPKYDEGITKYIAPVYSAPVTKEIKMPKQSSRTLEKLNNPIWAVTNALGGITNKEIDFGKSKANSKKKGDLYIKIGKFEFLRKSSK